MPEILTLPSRDEGPRVIVDVDRTVLDTPALMNDIADVLFTHFETSHNITTQTFSLEAIQDYYKQSGSGLQYYAFSEHLKACSIDTDIAEQYILEDLRGNDYLYDDVPGFFEFLDERKALEEIIGTELLTHGEKFLQNIKLKLSPRLGKYACTITLGPKDRYLAPGDIVIDDKYIQKLPRGAVQLLIARATSEESSDTYPNLTSIQYHWPDVLDLSRRELTQAA